MGRGTRPRQRIGRSVWQATQESSAFQELGKACEDQNLFTDPTEPRAHKIGVETGYFAASELMNDTCERLVDISNRIRSLTPTTLTGLAIWAQAALFESYDYEPRDVSFAESDWRER